MIHRQKHHTTHVVVNKGVNSQVLMLLRTHYTTHVVGLKDWPYRVNSQVSMSLRRQIDGVQAGLNLQYDSRSTNDRVGIIWRLLYTITTPSQTQQKYRYHRVIGRIALGLAGDRQQGLYEAMSTKHVTCNMQHLKMENPIIARVPVPCTANNSY